ncbi:hypothetical protein HRI_003556800 [Hibiscus trionum]|uniref:BRCT domain-containing protein n=1 Tax=Hibiscus trionum TaxID=183268 RepID=A0A9W7IPD8_HIBTR|nr:hypothetical protein HRI_003556800 [Hibiscus trionum]
MLDSDTPSKAFLGVRFCLYGFDPVNEHKVGVKLIDGGGVGVDQYTQNCTHLIVDKIVYDDPACVAARNDGKTVVTGLWVDHSFDIGMPVDATSIMYRPLRDLNGIPGAKSLIVCLTGYQRQDRDDIMTLVSLMGAQFSKPLVASKVTHLICYKFEGEKYELAKKIKKIKLINHRWLEDCLREWEILSEANYSKSGYELELTEAEAKDSDEEAEETTLKHSEQQRFNRSPHNFRAGMLSSRELLSTVEGSTWTIPKHSPNTKEVLVTPRKSHPGTSVNNVSSTKLARPGDISPNSKIMDNYLASTSKSPSSNQMFSAINYSNKSPRKPTRTSTPPNLSREESGNNSGSPQAMKIKDVSDVSSSKMQQPEERTGSWLDRSPWKESDLCHGKDSAGILPQKRALEVSGSSSKSQNMSNAKASVKGSALDTERWEPRSLGDHPQINDYAVNEPGHLNGVHSSCAGNATAKLSTDIFSSKIVTPEDRQNSRDKKSPGMSFSGYRGSTFAGKLDMQNEIAYEKSPQMSFKGLRESTPATRSNIGDYSQEQIQVGGEPGELQNKQQDVEVPSLDDRKLRNENSHSPSNLDVHEGGNDKSVTKSVSKKLAKRTKPVSKPDMQSENACEKSPQMSFKGLRETTYASRSNIGEYGLEQLQFVGEPGALQNKQQDVEVPSLDDRKLRNENSLSLSNLDVLEGGNDKSVTKSVSKKLVKMTKPVSKKLVKMTKPVSKPDIQSENAYEKSPQTSFKGLRETTSASRSNIGEYGLERLQVEESGELQNKQQDVEAPSLDERKLGDENSHSPINLNVLEGGNDKSTKPDTKKLAKKTLGPRPKLSNIANRKGSIYSSKIAAENHSTISLDGENERATHKSASEHEACPPTINLNAAKDVKEVTKCQNSATSKTQFTDDETQPPDEEDDNDPNKTAENEKSELVELTRKADTFVEVEHVSHDSNVAQHGSPIASENRTVGTDPESAVGSKDSEFGELTLKCDGLKKKANKRKKTSRAMMKADPSNSKNDLVGENGSVQKNVEEKENENENFMPHSAAKPESSAASSKVEISGAAEKSSPVCHGEIADKSVGKPNNKTGKSNEKIQKVDSNRQPPQKVLNRLKNEPLCFILSGHRLQRKEFQQVIRRLKGKFCRDSHQWSYQATHFIAPDPIRRTEKFFAAAASGRWILKLDYLSSCNQAGKFLAEEPYEWHKNGLSEDSAINLEAPRKWRQLQERTGHGAFYGMRIIVYGECIAPSLDTLKRAVKAGDGDILATSPPYTRFLKSGVDFAVVSPGMPRVDMWVQEFLKHEVPCVVADYLVEYVCKPGFSLERHVLYNTHEWADKSFNNLTSRAEEIVEDLTPEESPNDSEDNDVTCQVCGSGDRGEVMLICGDENGSLGCGVGTHIDCCDPPLDVIPEDDWFCPTCSRSSTNNTSSSRKRRKGASRSKGK